MKRSNGIRYDLNELGESKEIMYGYQMDGYHKNIDYILKSISENKSVDDEKISYLIDLFFNYLPKNSISKQEIEKKVEDKKNKFYLDKDYESFPHIEKIKDYLLSSQRIGNIILEDLLDNKKIENVAVIQFYKSLIYTLRAINEGSIFRVSQMTNRYGNCGEASEALYYKLINDEDIKDLQIVNINGIPDHSFTMISDNKKVLVLDPLFSKILKVQEMENYYDAKHINLCQLVPMKQNYKKDSDLLLENTIKECNDFLDKDSAKLVSSNKKEEMLDKSETQKKETQCPINGQNSC